MVKNTPDIKFSGISISYWSFGIVTALIHIQTFSRSASFRLFLNVELRWKDHATVNRYQNISYTHTCHLEFSLLWKCALFYITSSLFLGILDWSSRNTHTHIQMQWSAAAFLKRRAVSEWIKCSLQITKYQQINKLTNIFH